MWVVGCGFGCVGVRWGGGAVEDWCSLHCAVLSLMQELCGVRDGG